MLDPDPGSLFLPLNLILAFLLLVFTGLLSACQSALEALTPSLLREDPAGPALKKAAARQRGQLHALTFSRMGSTVFGCGHALLAIACGVLPAFARESTPLRWLWAALGVCGMVAVVCVFVIFAWQLPARAVRKDPDRFCRRHARLLLTLSGGVGWFLLRGCSRVANGFLRLRGMDPETLEEDVTEEDILQVVDEAEEQDAIEENEKDMIANILDFNDTTAEETMTHRTDIVAVPEDATVRQAVEAAVESGASRIPVYHEDIDTVVGICYVKDLLPYVGREIPEGVTVAGLMRPPYFVPESKKCSQLFTEMTDRKVQIAIVVDEYGGTAGLITLEDLVESIVGNIQDEYDKEEDGEPRQLSERAFTVDGTLPIDEARDLTEVDLPEGDYDTLGGLVIDRLGYLPKEGEHPKIDVAGMTITVLKVEDQRLARLLLVKKPPEEEEAHE